MLVDGMKMARAEPNNDRSNRFLLWRRSIFALTFVSICGITWAQQRHVKAEIGADEFGPVVRAYLDYLRAEEEVVDDRVSRREISPAYYLRNSRRIRALRQMVIRMVHETGNDYVPELVAVARDEFHTIFEKPPDVRSLHIGEVINETYRFLGTSHVGETFYIFARLDPYEQAELFEAKRRGRERRDANGASPHMASGARDPDSSANEVRPRRVNAP